LTAGGKERGGQAQAVAEKAADTGNGAAALSRKDQKRLDAELRQARSRQRRAQQQIVEQLEHEIHQREARQAELVAELEKPETYEKPGRAPEVNRELLDIQQRLPELNGQWEKEATRLGALEG
jgi:ATP-binding cassette subfamily F protein 3